MVLQPDGKYHIVFERVNGNLVKQRYLKDAFSECFKRMDREFENPYAMFSAHTISIPHSLISTFYDDYKTLVDRYMTYDCNEEQLEILQVCTQAVPLVSFSTQDARA